MPRARNKFKLTVRWDDSKQGDDSQEIACSIAEYLQTDTVSLWVERVQSVLSMSKAVRLTEKEVPTTQNDRLQLEAKIASLRKQLADLERKLLENESELQCLS